MALYEYYEDTKRYYVVTELCEGGELFEKIVQNAFMTENYVARIMKQVLLAITYCHEKKIVHRDLKLENILLDKTGTDADIKIIDFGTAAVFDPKQKLSIKKGTPFYIAPEVWKKNYGPKCDIWSAGVVLYVLLSGYPPFFGTNDKEIMRNVLKGTYSMSGDIWGIVSKDGKDLVKKMLTYDPDKRISAAEALMHPWITQKGSSKKDYEIVASTAHLALSNLRKFRADNMLKKAVLTFIVTQLIEEKEKRDLLKLFQVLDKNGDGKLSKEELLEGCDKVFGAIAADDLQETFNNIDIDKSGSIDYNEFIMATLNDKHILSEKNIQEAFNLIDKDSSGAITIDEIKELIGVGQEISDDTFKEIISEVDSNGDGEINFDEFRGMLLKISEHHEL